MSDDRCPSCGYCKHCGRSDRLAYVPAPYPVFPMTPSPTWYETPWWERVTTGDPFTFRTTSGM